MEFRNIHLAPAPAEEAAPPTMEAVAAALPEKMRLRKIAVSPLEEYALREGTVRPISDALAACILSFKGRAEVNGKGVKIDRVELGGVRVYFHADSRICSDLSSRERKWTYFINRNKPDRIHLFDDEGRYVETLPEKFMPAALDLPAQAAAIAEDKRAIKRAADHLQRLHGEETWEALEAARKNKELTTRYVQTLEAPAGIERLPAADPVEGGTADRIACADRTIDQAINRRSSAIELGRALNAKRGAGGPPAKEPVEAEDWTNLRGSNLTPATTQTEIESW